MFALRLSAITRPLFATLVVLLLSNLATTTAVAQRGSQQPWPPEEALPVEEAPEPERMEYTPPRDADRFEDFVPPNVEVKQVTIRDGEEKDTALDLNNGDVFSTRDQRLGIVIEKNTVSQTSDLRIKVEKFLEPEDIKRDLATIAAEGAEDIEGERYDNGLEIGRFDLAIRDRAKNEKIERFDKYVRIVLDLREYGYDMADHGAFYLAYQDPENEDIWIDVPVTVHQTTGLISAELPHFSSWATGWRPEGWTLDWSPPGADGFSGASTYQHAFDLPPGRNGLQPSLNLSYSNSAMNGAMRRVSSGSIASGWSITQIAVVRTGVGLNSSGTGMDYPDKYRLVINGTGYELVSSTGSGTSGTQYYVENAPSIRVIRYTNYWVATTGDGTQYRMGYTAESRTNHRLNFNGTAQGLNPIEWHADTVTDLYGNQITYHYNNSVKTEHNQFSTGGCGGVCTYIRETYNSRIQNIYYNFSGVAGLPVTETVGRLNSSTAATRIQFEYNTTSNIWISAIKIYHNSTAPYREYEMSYGVNSPSNNCSNGSAAPTTRLLLNLTEYGWGRSSGGTLTKYSLPAVTFTYTDRENFLNGGTTPCFEFSHLKTVNNGYGAETEFFYVDDGRQWGSFTNSGGYVTYPDVVRSHYVNKIENSDGMGNTQKIEFERTDPCYNQTGTTHGPECGDPDDAPDIGYLRGFEHVTTKFYDYDNSLIRQNYTHYLTQDGQTGANRDLVGRANIQQLKDATGKMHSQTKTYWTVSTFGNSIPFVYAYEKETFQYNPNNNSHYLYNKTAYEYATNAQGGVQYGNLTAVKEYTVQGSSTPYRITNTYFSPNTTSWIVNKPTAQSLSNGAGNVINGSWFYYDNNTTHASSPSQGFLARVRQFDKLNNCSELPSNGGTGCAHPYRTIDQTFTDDIYGNILTTTSYSDYGYRAYNSNFSQQTYNQYPTQARTTTIDYGDDYNLYPVKMSNDLGHSTEFEVYGFENADGVVTSMTNLQEQRGLLKEVIDPNMGISHFRA